MSDLATERGHLAKAERDIAEGEDRIREQAGLVERLRETGRDVVAAKVLLANLRETLAGKDHRDETLRTSAP